MAKPKLPQIIKEIRDFKIPDFNYAYQKQISYSQFSIFNQCPHRWALLYRDGHYVSESSIHTTFGTAIHTVIQRYLTEFYTVSGAAADRLDLEEIFEDELKTQYRKDYEKNGKKHFSNPDELREFFDDGVQILNYLKKNKRKYFDQRDVHLVGIEIPVVITPNPKYKNVIYKGYLDIVLYYEKLNKIKIIDIKTSKSGWRDYEKKDDIKTSQLILYKKFLSDLFNFPIENISIEYFITKRKVYDHPDFPIKRFQIFEPSNGKNSISKACRNFNSFIENVFELDGSFKTTKFEAKPSQFNCGFCPFSNNSSLCPNAFQKT